MGGNKKHKTGQDEAAARESEDNTDEKAAERASEPAASTAATTGGVNKNRKGSRGRKDWVVGNRAKDRRGGFDAIGVLFYNTVKKAFKEIP